MNAILIDVKRGMRSLMGMAHALCGALRRSGLSAGSGKGNPSHGSVARPLNGFADLYGRFGKADAYTSGEVLELYRKMSFDRMPPL